MTVIHQLTDTNALVCCTVRDERCHRPERAYGPFRRACMLPTMVDQKRYRWAITGPLFKAMRSF
jgi:hypothetical protein